MAQDTMVLVSKKPWRIRICEEGRFFDLTMLLCCFGACMAAKQPTRIHMAGRVSGLGGSNASVSRMRSTSSQAAYQAKPGQLHRKLVQAPNPAAPTAGRHLSGATALSRLRVPKTSEDRNDVKRRPSNSINSLDGSTLSSFPRGRRRLKRPSESRRVQDRRQPLCRGLFFFLALCSRIHCLPTGLHTVDRPKLLFAVGVSGAAFSCSSRLCRNCRSLAHDSINNVPPKESTVAPTRMNHRPSMISISHHRD
jgi:hypothetical protein